MFFLQLRMWFLLTVLFAIVYAIVVMIGTALGMQNFYMYLFIAFAMMAVQYFLGPKIVEWTMGVRYVRREDYPELYAAVEEQSVRAGIPMPRVYVIP